MAPSASCSSSARPEARRREGVTRDEAPLLPETDSLYIDLKQGQAADSQEVADGVVIDLDAEGRLVGIDIDRAGGQFDLATL